MLARLFTAALLLSTTVGQSAWEIPIEGPLEEVIREHVEPSPLHFAIDVEYTGLRWFNLAVERTTMGQQYGAFGNGGRIAFEYMPIQSIGRLGIGLGVTFYGQPDIKLSGNRYTSVIGIPIDLSLSYRASFSQRQWVVPFLKGGIGAVGIKQTSKTNGPDQVVQIEGMVQASLGMEFCLSRLDTKDSNLLDASMGINSIYLVTEYTRSQMLGASALDLSFESYQAGLRFEF